MGRRLKGIFSNFFELRIYIVVATLVFVLGMFLGSEWTAFHDFLSKEVESLAGVAGQLNELDNAGFWIFLFIFLNNTIKSILIIFLGALFGVLPILFLAINGMVLGYMHFLFNDNGLTIWQLLVGILPHGIIELPVVIIACAYGIRMGVIVLKKIFPWFVPQTRRTKGEMVAFLQRTLPFMVFVTVSLLIAATIEATITPWLLGLIF